MVLATTLLVACGDDGGGEDESFDGVTTEAFVFGDGDEVVLRVETGGGFVPVIVNWRQVPEHLLFDDGRLVRLTSEAGAVVPTFEAVGLDEGDTADLLDAADAVIDGPDPGFPNVTDLPTTSVTLTTGGDERTLDVYALGFEDDTALGNDEAAARAAVVDLLEDLAAAEPAVPFVPDEWLALTTATLEGADVVSATVWPFDDARAASAEAPQVCTAVQGEEADQLLAAAAEDEFGYVTANGTVVELALQPVLAGGETCAAFEGFVER